MAMKQTGRKVYKSMQGKQIDMDLLRQRNELTPAVGNARVNARGDELGPGGKIVRKREDVLKNYFQNPGSVPEETTLKQTKSAPVEETKSSTSSSTKRATTRAQEKLAQVEEEWIEDEEGNFVKKGE